MLPVSVIIVNWNTGNLLSRCLQCIDADPADLPLEVIVVDNASSDDSLSLLREQFPTVRVIANSDNVGFAKAVNQGIRAAQGEYFLLLNSDAFIYPGALNALWQAMEARPETGAAGCHLVYEDGRLQRSCFAFPTLWTESWRCLGLDRFFPKSHIFGAYQMTYWDLDDSREVDCIMGACLLIRRETLDEIGLLDERFFMFSEEVDLCYRMKQAGWKVFFVHDATATHIWGGSSRMISRKSFLELYKSRVMFFRKHYGPMNAFILKTLLFASGAGRGTLGWLASRAVRRPGIAEKTGNYLELSRLVWNY
jgi:GT2 family glycosyltransferase